MKFKFRNSQFACPAGRSVLQFEINSVKYDSSLPRCHLKNLAEEQRVIFAVWVARLLPFGKCDSFLWKSLGTRFFWSNSYLHDLTFCSGTPGLKNLANLNTFSFMQTTICQVAINCSVTALDKKVLILLHQRKVMDYF